MSCVLCKNEGISGTLQIPPYTLNICDGCGMFTLFPYGSSSDEVRHDDDIDPQHQSLYEVQFYKKYFDKIRPFISEKSSVLDIGCGAGTFLKLVSSYAEKSVGIELNPKRLAFARKQTQCDIYQEPIELFEFQHKFDVILLSNVFSHIDLKKDPFQDIVNNLKPSGKLILITGELDSRVKKGSIFDWGLPEHRQFLGLKTMTYFCQKYQLKIVKHDRKLMSDELFSKEYFLSPGRSRIRNILKKVIVSIPFGLLGLKTCYDLVKGKYVYSSFICLEKLD